jgi:hypothetical protein
VAALGQSLGGPTAPSAHIHDRLTLRAFPSQPVHEPPEVPSPLSPDPRLGMTARNPRQVRAVAESLVRANPAVEGGGGGELGLPLMPEEPVDARKRREKRFVAPAPEAAARLTERPSTLGTAQKRRPRASAGSKLRAGL